MEGADKYLSPHAGQSYSSCGDDKTTMTSEMLNAGCHDHVASPSEGPSSYPGGPLLRLYQGLRVETRGQC